MENKALDKVIARVYEKILENGDVTDNQLILILSYLKYNNNVFKEILKGGEKISNIISKTFGGE